MNIKIIGTNCSNGIKLKKIVSRAIEDLEIKTNIDFVDDERLIKKHNIKNVPALIIEDKKVSEGRVLTVREVIKYINSCYAC